MMDLYLARFRDREQHDAFDDSRQTRFDAFGQPIDTPTIEGFESRDFDQTLANQRAQAQALARLANERPRGTTDRARLHCIKVRKYL